MRVIPDLFRPSEIPRLRIIPDTNEEVILQPGVEISFEMSVDTQQQLTRFLLRQSVLDRVIRERPRTPPYVVVLRLPYDDYDVAAQSTTHFTWAWAFADYDEARQMYEVATALQIGQPFVEAAGVWFHMPGVPEFEVGDLTFTNVLPPGQIVERHLALFHAIVFIGWRQLFYDEYWNSLQRQQRRLMLAAARECEHELPGDIFPLEEYAETFEVDPPEPRGYSATVTVRALVPYEDWDSDDQQGNPPGQYTFQVVAAGDAAAREAVLDQFHKTVPISMLEDFDIEVEIAGVDSGGLLPPEPKNTELPS